MMEDTKTPEEAAAHIAAIFSELSSDRAAQLQEEIKRAMRDWEAVVSEAERTAEW